MLGDLRSQNQLQRLICFAIGTLCTIAGCSAPKDRVHADVHADFIRSLGGKVTWDDSTVVEVQAHHNLGNGQCWDDRDLEKAVAHIAQLPNVQKIDLDLTNITDRGISYFPTIPSLRELSIQVMGGGITDEAI